MTYDFDIRLDGLFTSAAFGEATAEELRVLLALVASDGKATRSQLATKSGVGEVRVASAITLFSEAGVLLPHSNVTDEFKSLMYKGEIEEESGVQVARTIRDNSLREVIEGFAQLMNKTPAELTPFELNRISGLCSQYGLSAEFIAVYMSYLNDKGRLTSVNALVSGAVRLHDTGVNTVEQLEVYIRERDAMNEAFIEIKKLLGIYGRRLSKSEEGYFNKWTVDFGYSSAIIGEAYDITALSTGKAELRYMDTILTEWNKAGATTVEECRTLYEKHKSEIEKGAKSTVSRREREKPRYGDFDPEEAMRNAIANSLLDDDDL